MEQKQLKYFNLMNDLKEKIVSGEIKAGDKLPSENELASDYQISRHTVRKALSILENDGYIYAEHGKGTFCKDSARHTRSSKNIAVVITYLSDYIFPRVIEGIDNVMTREGYSIILKNTKNSRSYEARCLEELLEKDVDGIIIEPSKSHVYCRHTNLYEKLDVSNIPYVFIQGCFEKMNNKPQVLMDDCKGGYMITKHLIETGHKNIAGVFKSDDIQGQNRHRGYVMALAEAGITYDPDKVVWFFTEDRRVHPYEGIYQMAKNGILIDAVVCYNDQIAIKVIQALKAAGLNVPHDVSVTGYDNSRMQLSEELCLTSIDHPQEKLGEMAAELLLELIQNKDVENIEHKLLIEPELVIGNTSIKRLK